MQAQLGTSLFAPPQADQLLLYSLKDRRKCLLELGLGLWSVELLLCDRHPWPLPKESTGKKGHCISLCLPAL